MSRPQHYVSWPASKDIVEIRTRRHREGGEGDTSTSPARRGDMTRERDSEVLYLPQRPSRARRLLLLTPVLVAALWLMSPLVQLGALVVTSSALCVVAIAASLERASLTFSELWADLRAGRFPW